MRSHDPHDPIDAVVDDAKAGLADAIAAEQAALRPDFAAILEEARRRGVTSGGATSAADRLEDLRLRDADDDLDGDDDFAADAALSALLDEARAEIDADRAARRLLPLPPAPAPAAPAPASPRRWLGAALAIAAAVALLWGVGPYLARPLGGSAQEGSQAQYRDRVDGETRGAAELGGPEDDAPRRGGRRGRAAAAGSDLPEGTGSIDPVPSDLSEEAALPEAALVDEASAAAGDPADAAPRADEAVEADAAPAPEVRAERPTDAGALEREVEARWRAGDLAGAERALRSIIRDVHDRRRVDLAYGDLFTITRQLHGREREAAVWREYLRRYPRGHYADDARAGLCRRAEGEALAPCWDRYLADFPAGAHRAEAERERGAP